MTEPKFISISKIITTIELLVNLFDRYIIRNEDMDMSMHGVYIYSAYSLKLTQTTQGINSECWMNLKKSLTKH